MVYTKNLQMKLSLQAIIKIILSVLFFLCLLDMPYGFYQLVRIVALLIGNSFGAPRGGRGLLENAERVCQKLGYASMMKKSTDKRLTCFPFVRMGAPA